jgi:endonuclease/exonuclease/phosphatase family metal-dependent hydrolase
MHFAHASLNAPRGKEQKSKQWYLDFEEPIAAEDTGDTGLAVLSRIPISSAVRIDLPWSDCIWRPRLAIESVFRFGKSTLHVFNSHIDPHASTDEQLEQHRAILAREKNACGPTVLLGDFNTLTSESRLRMRTLLETHGYSTPLPSGIATWRSGFIRLQPDWIFVKDVNVTRWGVARGLSVSDHWPVWAELDIDGLIRK